jgi:hypothetical protein
MGLIKASKTQIGHQNYIFECLCGAHMIRIVKDDRSEPSHAIEFWEYRGAISWNFWKRFKLAFRIMIGKEAKYAISEMLIGSEDVEPLASAILSLNNVD